MLSRSKKSTSSITQVGDWSRQDTSNASTENLTSGDIGWVGPINLRRRAKPELENERHRDISLRLSVQEVKQLPSKGKYFCEICLDRTLYARTTSKQSNGTVFWGEKFELNNLPDVSIITINLYKQGDPSKEKRSRTKGQNQFLAFVTIPLKEVPQKSEMQQWLAMQSPNLIQLDHWQGGSNGVSSPGAPRFRKRSTPITCFRHSTSASAFSILNEAVDENLVTDEKSNSSVAANSRGRKKTWTAGISSPDKELSREPRSIGGLSISSSSCTTRNGLDAACVPSAFVGSNITNSFVLPDNGPMPQIRVNLQYEAMDVLPIDYYGELREFIKMHSISLVRFLEPQLTAKQKEELASCLVNIYEKLPDLSVAQLLTELLQEDLRQHHDESMIFRSNSTGSKAVECYIKLVGNDYLRQTLKTSIDQLLSTSEDFEIDPSRVTSIESNGTANQAIQVDKNREALIRHLKVIWGLIFSSAPALPRELREVFASLSYSVEQTHSSKTAARLISSCLFLRFICPAIHGPVLFGLTAAVPESGRLSRNLTLVAKVLQNLANLALFEEKERHMRSLNTFVEAEIPRMHSFLQSISAMPADEEATETTDCHKFIDLGYEFAKLTSLLVAYTRDRTLPEELCDLFGILSFIDEHTNDAFLSSWTPDVVSCRRYASCDSAGPLLPNRPRFNSTDSVPCLPAVQGQSEKDGFSNYSSTMEDSGMGSQSAFLNEHGTGLQRAVAQSSSTALSSHRGSTSESALETFCLPEPLEDDEENAEDLITQYQEQLRQLNACIDRVESSEVCPRAITSHPHVMRVNGPGTPTQLVPGPKDSKPSVVLPANRDLSISHIPTHSATAVMANGMEELCGVSDYESGDLTERSEGLCHSEPMNTRGRPADSGTSEQLDLSGSPSLDQLAERLHELRLLLKHERQELEQVVATKTQVIQQQEQSIEQLASELNQLRRAPVTQEPGRDRQSNGRKWPSGTVSPSSSCSLSSECQMSYQSDGACPLTDDFSGLSCDAGAFTTSSTQNPELSFGTPLTMVFGNGVQPRAQRFRAKAWSDRTEPTILTSTKTSNTDAMNRYGPNLLDLSRASEGTGIPLGDLIVSKQSLPVRRRLSESKLLHP
ncbi:putative Ras GTPase-activating protein [Fasciola hepatica]|uniref:Ras GTPase-activating protein n=1 Tax=Fasciola hepatica TaxID=6192 RepID=A0A4E0RH79_FASHE|nr:putative Ras GTPase-activating protein [Fasciola hepatica]